MYESCATSWFTAGTDTTPNIRGSIRRKKYKRTQGFRLLQRSGFFSVSEDNSQENLPVVYSGKINFSHAGNEDTFETDNMPIHFSGTDITLTT